MSQIYQPKIVKPMSGDIKKYHKIVLEANGYNSSINDYKKKTGDKAKAYDIYNDLYDQLQNTIFQTNKEEYKKHHQSLAQYNKEKKQKKQLEKKVSKQQKEIAELKQQIQKPFNHLNTLAKSYKPNQPTKVFTAQRKKRY